MSTLFARFRRADWMTKVLVIELIFFTVFLFVADATVHFHNWWWLLAGCAIYLSAANALLEGAK